LKEFLLEIALGICLGLGLAAACGFRVFVPMFVLALAARSGYVGLADGLEWMNSWGAVAAFGTATLLEAVAYYVPWLDHALDVTASPAAIVAGVVTTAACVVDADPLLQWSAAVVGGAGVAGAVQSATVATRSASTLTTAGFANFLVATAEVAGSVLLSVLALLLPVVAAAVAVTLAVAAIVIAFRLRRRIMSRRPSP
jgi:hypothetical protein